MSTETALNPRRFTLLPAVATVALALLTAPAAWADVEEEEVFETSVALGGGGRVEVETRNGSIHVETWDASEVKVVARKKVRADDSGRAMELLEEIEVRVEESGGTVRIDAETPRSRWSRDESATVSFEVTIPADAELEATSSNGSVEARGIGGAAELETSNGSIKARGVGGMLYAKSNNGSIKAFDLGGSVEAKTNNGSIEADIASSGLDGDVRMTTNNGSVTLRLEAGVAASIDARTRNGTVRSDFSGGIQDERKKTLRHDLNGGGPRVVLESTNGSIRLRER